MQHGELPAAADKPIRLAMGFKEVLGPDQVVDGFDDALTD